MEQLHESAQGPRIQFAKVEPEKPFDYLKGYIDRNQIKEAERLTVTFEKSTTVKAPTNELTTQKIFKFFTTGLKAVSPEFEKGINHMEKEGFRMTAISHGGPTLSQGREQDRFSRDIQSSVGKQAGDFAIYNPSDSRGR